MVFFFLHFYLNLSKLIHSTKSLRSDAIFFNEFCNESMSKCTNKVNGMEYLRRSLKLLKANPIYFYINTFDFCFFALFAVLICCHRGFRCCRVFHFLLLDKRPADWSYHHSWISILINIYHNRFLFFYCFIIWYFFLLLCEKATEEA